MATLQYNAAAPVTLQPDDWSCSVESTKWMMRSLGRNPQDSWIRPSMLSNRIVSQQDGLLDASGRQLVAWLQREYGDEMGLTFRAINPVYWDQLVDMAGHRPILIGGRAWNHWTGVRAADSRGLLLANPAPNWREVGDILDREEFNRLGGFSAVIACTDEETREAPDPLPPAPSPEPVDLRVRDLELRLSSEISTRGYLTKDVADALQAIVDTLRRHAP